MEAAPTTELVAAFASDVEARRAAQQLHRAGIDPSMISVMRTRSRSPQPSEAPTLTKVFWSGLFWSIVGGVAGALLGLVVALLGWGLPGTPDNIAIQIASWAMFLHVLGALLGCYIVLDTGDRFATKADHHDSDSTLLRVRAEPSTEAPCRELLTRAGGILR